jgi:hypothetical protein
VEKHRLYYFPKTKKNEKRMVITYLVSIGKMGRSKCKPASPKDGSVTPSWGSSRPWRAEHLAAVAGLSLRTIQRVESEGSGSLETRMALASAFNVMPGSGWVSREVAAKGGSDSCFLSTEG